MSQKLIFKVKPIAGIYVLAKQVEAVMPTNTFDPNFYAS
jgi:hypothetical protein